VSTSITDDQSAPQFQSISPIFLVGNLRRAIDYYVGALGFAEEFVYGDPPFYGSVTAGNVHINLREIHTPVLHSREDRTDTVDAYILVTYVDILHDRCRAAGTKIVFGPKTMDYGMREFYVEDPDRYRVAFGQQV
jgi:catechol 2,3-dioxygenase-like lactoylglutathione lyase family enzyme